MHSNSFHRLKELSPQSYNWTIKVRIIRLWRGTFKNGQPFKSLNMLLLDDKNTRMHAFLPDAIVGTHEEKLKEGHIYILSNFSVKDYKTDEKFRCVNNDRQIIFTNYTLVELHNEDDKLIAKNMFDFYDLGDLQEIANKNVYLTDVIGVVYKDSPIRKLKNKFNEPQVQVKFTIVDGRSSVDVTFWGSVAEKFSEEFENLQDYPAIIIITSAKISSWQGTNHSTPQLDVANTSATAFYLNYGHHSVFQLRNMMATPLFSNYDFSSQIPEMLPILKIENIKKLGKEYAEKEVICHLKVINVASLQRWFYYECTSCYNVITPREGMLSCYRCNNKEIICPYKKFEVDVETEDSTGQIDIILLDRAIKTIIGMDVDEIEEMGTKDEELPNIIKTIENQSFTVKLLIRSNNVGKTSSSYQCVDVCETQVQNKNAINERLSESMQISATRASTSSYHLDDLSQLNFQTPEVAKKKTTNRKKK